MLNVVEDNTEISTQSADFVLEGLERFVVIDDSRVR